MAKKELVYQGLENINVIVEDKSTNSPDYFRITKLPLELNAGVNTLRFKGNNDVFFEGAEVLVEVLDSNGDPIYYEINLDLESSEQVAVVNIFINQDTAPGPATIFLVSTLSKLIDQTTLNTDRFNIRWSTTVYIDISKPNPEEIVFSRLPTVNVTAGTGSYTNLSYSSSFRSNAVSYSQTGTKKFNYLYRNGTALIVTASNSTQYFSSSVELATITISSSFITNSTPSLRGTVSTGIFTSSLTFSGSGIAYLTDPLTYNLVNSNEVFQPSYADISDFTINYIQASSGVANSTENTYNSVIATFYGLQPLAGTISKIRSYYRSTGVLEYIFLNETEITSLSDEFGFSPNVVTASFTLPTVQRNDRIDFKFEFINPVGTVSKQIVESLNNLFIGGNTYIGGDDNLLTGSLFVAGATGTGVHISGKGSAAMVRSIGYEGFAKAVAGTSQSGFVLYSGSVQPLLNASEQYSGVGLEMVANSASYFKYTTSGSGLLEIRTARFFLGNSSNSISGSDGNITISGSNVSINTPTFFLGNSSNYISGSEGNIVVSGSNLSLLTSKFYLGNASSYISSSNGNVSLLSSKFRLSESGQVTASAILVNKTVGASNQIMIDTTKAILDATNLGRTVYSNSNEYSINVNGAGPGLQWLPIGEVVFQGLQNEYTYVVSYQQKIDIISVTSGTGAISTAVTARLKYAPTGSSTTDSSYYDSWTNSDAATGGSLTRGITSPGPGISSKTYSEDQAPKLDLSNITYINDIGKLFKLELSMSFTVGASQNVNATAYTKNITVTGTRGLGSSWNQGLSEPVV